jgi:hypothetical protein
MNFSSLKYILVLIVVFTNACSTQKPITAAKVKPESNVIFPEIPLSLYYREAQIRYGIAQDSLNFYVAIEAVEPVTCGKILSRGLLVSFNTNGKKKQEFGIKYPVGAMGKQKMEPLNLTGNAMQNRAAIQEQLDNLQELMLFENGETEGGVYPLAMIKGIKVKLTATDFGGIVYQLRISKNRLKYSPTTEKPLGIGIAIEAIRAPLGGPVPDGTSMSGGMPAGQSMTQTMNGQQQMMGQPGMMGGRQSMGSRMRADSYSQGFDFWVFVK